MRRMGGGFGLVVLVVVVVIVLLLATKAWEEVMPAASQVSDPGPNGAYGVTAPDHGQEEAADALRSSELPDLDEMRRNTSNHARDVQDILGEADGGTEDPDNE